VVHGQPALARLRATVLAGVVVARQDGAARERRPQMMRHAHVVDQPDDQGHRQDDVLGTQHGLGCFYDLSFLLQQQHHSAAQRHHAQWLVSCVQY